MCPSQRSTVGKLCVSDRNTETSTMLFKDDKDCTATIHQLREKVTNMCITCPAVNNCAKCNTMASHSFDVPEAKWTYSHVHL